MQITVYMKQTCKYSQRAMKLLRERGLSFEQVDVGRDPLKLAEMKDRAMSESTPQIFIGEYHVGGYDNLVGLDSTGRLDQLLGGAEEPASLVP